MTIQTTTAPLATPAAHADTRAVLLNEVSWGAIFAGAVTALVAQVIINLVGVGVGLASVGTSAADNPAASTVSLGAGLWFVASGIVASLAGGAIAGRLSGKTLPGAAALHGLVSWAVTTLVVLYLLTSAATGLVGGTLSTVSGALGGAGNLVGGTIQTAAQAAAPSLAKVSNPLDGIEQKVREQAAGQDPQAARDAAVAAVRAVLTGDLAQKEQAKAGPPTRSPRRRAPRPTRPRRRSMTTRSSTSRRSPPPSRRPRPPRSRPSLRRPRAPSTPRWP